MCRHICPIGNASGQERNTSRARALSLSMVTRGEEYSEDKIENVYECALCGACTKDCLTGFDPVKFTKEARLIAALDGKLPAYISKLAENAMSTGNVYAAKYGAKLKKVIAALPEKADTLFLLGKDAPYKCPDNAAEAIELLTRAKVSFTVLADEPASGYALDFLIGAADETKKQMEKAAAVINGYKTVVCYDPADAKVLLREYKEWGIAVTAKVYTFTAYLSKLIKGGSIKPKKSEAEYTYQDSPLLARDLEETEKARNVLASCGTLREMLVNSGATILAGNLIMNEYMPEVMAHVAEDRWQNAKGVGAVTVVTACPAEYVMLKATKPASMNLKTIEEVLL